jgi:hypothetical protein
VAGGQAALAADRGHRGGNALISLANACPNVTITVTRAI